MGHEAAIVHRNAFKTIDEEYLKIVSSTYGEYVGFAIAIDGEITTSAYNDVNQALEDINDTSKGQDEAFTVIFSKGLSHEEDQQPFVVLTKDDKTPLCVIFMEGNFSGSGYEPAGDTPRADEWAVLNGYLMEKLTQLAIDTDEDQNKMVEYLQKPFNQREMLKSICPLPGARCEMLIFFANGQIVNLHKGDLHKEFDWGTTSQILSYESEPAAGNAGKETLSLKDQLAAKKAARNRTSVPPTGKTDTAVAAALKAAEINNKEDERPYVLPPKHRCKSKKDLESCYQYIGGYSPEGWEEGVSHPERAKPVRLKKEIWENQTKFTELLTKGSFILVKGDKAPAVHPSGGSKIETTLLSAGDREGLIKVFKPKLVKSIDDKSSFVDDPVKLAEDLKNKEMLTQALPGLFVEGIATVFSWGPDAFDALIKTNPAVARMLLEEMRFRLWQAFGMLKKEEKDKIAM